jgi:hypothetical protein
MKLLIFSDVGRRPSSAENGDDNESGVGSVMMHFSGPFFVIYLWCAFCGFILV